MPTSKLSLSSIKIPKSPTALIMLATLFAIIGFVGWTGYAFFIATPASEPIVATPREYYPEDLKAISEALDEFDSYDINVGVVETGRQDPFDSF